MANFLDNLSTNPIFVVASGIAGISGLGLSVYGVCVEWRLKKKINLKLQDRSNIRAFNANREHHAEVLMGFKSSIAVDNLLNPHIVSELKREIDMFEQYGVVSSKDRKQVKQIQKHLDSNLSKINRSKLCNQVSYFISAYGRAREENLWV